MDALSEILRAINLRKAVFFHARLTAPWRVDLPHGSALAEAVGPGVEHLVMYHFLIEGECQLRSGSHGPLQLKAGDVVLLPHGDAHSLASSATAVASQHDPKALLRQRPRHVEFGGGGTAARFICGFMACDARLSRPLLDALPRVLTVGLRDGDATSWLERSILDAASEASLPKPGGETVLAKLSELLLVETLRRYIAQVADGQQSWLGGLRDRMVGRCLSLMHERPSHPWTVEGLAREVGVSRSVLAERFVHFVGQPPIQYLSKWRMALAAHYLQSTSLSVSRIADEVGYETDAAFNRAFRREYGTPPATWRRAALQAGDRPPHVLATPANEDAMDGSSTWPGVAVSA